MLQMLLFVEASVEMPWLLAHVAWLVADADVSRESRCSSS